MTGHPLSAAFQTARDGLLAALLFVSQTSLAWLPNVELVSLLLFLYTLVFGRHVWLILYVFVALEGLLYGFGLWWASYLYVWALLCQIVFLLARSGKPSSLSVSLVSGIFGMVFGLLCSIPYLISGGPGAALSWWLAGIPFDLLHGVSNFLLSMVLFSPLYRVFTKLKNLQP